MWDESEGHKLGPGWPVGILKAINSSPVGRKSCSPNTCRLHGHIPVFWKPFVAVAVDAART